MSDADQDPEGRTVIAAETDGASVADVQPPRREGGIASGDLLNGIYRVGRFIARGGMGEVYEGTNVETEDRVAIKAIRSHLAADPKVLAMFRKEARVLTQISHPAIVQYRVLARDPQLDLLYIVTDFIDGEPLSMRLDGTRPGAAQIVRLARRLAEGLEAAHEHGAIHRDMSPDNVLLPGDSIDRARIIDFGIAKSLDVTAETVVGDGFAGKLGYVAPEQFGDFDRQIGPWTDVYSTALVLLAYARGKAPDMGTTLSEAVERRRTAPDLDGLPPVLEPLIGAMLRPDPSERTRSMAEVLAEMDRLEIPSDEPEPPVVSAIGPHVATTAPGSERPEPAPLTTFAPVTPDPASTPPPQPAAGRAPIAARPPSPRPTSAPHRRPMFKVAATMLVAILAGWFVWSRPRPAPHAAAATPVAAMPVAASVRPQPVAAVNSTLAPHALFLAGLSKLPCTWLDAKPAASGTATNLSGGAVDPAALKDQVVAVAQKAGDSPPSIDSTAVVQIPASRCDLVGALREFDAGDAAAGGVLTLSTPHIALAKDRPGCPPGVHARADVSIAERDPGKNFALLAIAPSGEITQIVASREQFAWMAQTRPEFFQDHGDGHLQVGMCYRSAGTVGLVLVEGSGLIDLGLTSGMPIQPAGYFSDRFREMARQHGWTTRAVWFRIDAEPAPTPSPIPSPTLASNRVAVPAVSTPARIPLAGVTSPGTAAPDHPVANQSGTATYGVALCRRYESNNWRDLGYLPQNACVVRIFLNRCEASYGQFGNTALRRYNGHIEARRGSHWWRIANDRECGFPANSGLFGLFKGHRNGS